MKIKVSSNALIVLALVIACISVVFYVFSSGLYGSDRSSQSMSANSFGESSYGPLHWHPKVSITIDGQRQYIPVNIGITVGKIMDTEVAGMRMSPMHTHEDDGTIHMEQQRPTNRTMKLGYFFDVWDKEFSSECIFEYCSSDEKTLSMFVNGEPNYEFDDYMFEGDDFIEIVYE